MRCRCNLTLTSSLVVNKFILNSLWANTTLCINCINLVLPKHLNPDSSTVPNSNRHVKGINHTFHLSPFPFSPLFFSWVQPGGVGWGGGCSRGNEYSEAKEILTTSITAWSRSANAAATQPWKNLSCFSASMFWSKIEKGPS